MTDLELHKLSLEALECVTGLTNHDDELYDAIDALRERLAQPEQEPVAWVRPNGEIVVRTDYGGRLYYSEQNVYTAPPSREWVGLTEDEMHECWGDPLTPLGMKHARMIEAKLKEKNA